MARYSGKTIGQMKKYLKDVGQRKYGEMTISIGIKKVDGHDSKIG